MMGCRLDSGALVISEGFLTDRSAYTWATDRQNGFPKFYKEMVKKLGDAQRGPFNITCVTGHVIAAGSCDRS